MNIPDFFSTAIEIELIVSEIYALIAANTSDLPTVNKIELLSKEEVNHANILQTGKSYQVSMPDLFVGLKIDAEEARDALREANDYRSLYLQKKTPFLTQLKTMLDFERRFEKIHLAASVQINDKTLKKLFISLQAGDNHHISTLTELIDIFKYKE